MRTIFKEAQFQIQKKKKILKRRRMYCLNSHPIIQGSQKRKHSRMPVMHKTIKSPTTPLCPNFYHIYLYINFGGKGRFKLNYPSYILSTGLSVCTG